MYWPLRLPLSGAPATPDADSARRAAEDELAKPAYHPRPNLLQLLWKWFQRQVESSRLFPDELPAWVSMLIVLTAAVFLLGVLVIVLRRFTRVQRRRRLGSLFDSDLRDAAALARDADAAAQAGDFATAVVERFRAIIRSLDERGLLEDYPGMTAQEASVLAQQALTGAHTKNGESLVLDPQLHEAGNLFDTVRYGENEPTTQQDQWMRELAAQVESCIVPQRSASSLVVAP
ncbi:DUF4129 domain-containing protein [Actinomyces trachealis]|nr:DUF4129 domain-containing protein [Actinomyces trachealis]